MKKLKNEYSRLRPNEFRPFTVNLTPENYDRLKQKNIYFSKLVNDFLKDAEKIRLLSKYPKNIRYSFKDSGRIVSSVSIDYNFLDKIDGVNLTCLVNDLIKKILK